VPVVLNVTTNAGPCPQSYTLVRVWSAADDCGNAVGATQRVTVVDTTPPVFVQLPIPVTNECDAVQAPPTLNAVDNCAPTVTVTLVTTTNAGSCPQSYTLVRVWTARDPCNNAASITQRVTVVDTKPPTFTFIPTNTQEQCDGVGPAPEIGAVDNCSSNPLVTFSVTTNAGSCLTSYALVRVWTASDECGNRASATQVVTVVDTTPPVISCPENLSVTNIGDCDYIVPDLGATAYDLCGGTNVTIVQNPAAGTVLTGPSTNVVVITAYDACSNQASCTVTITLECLRGQIGDTIWVDTDFNGQPNENLLTNGLNGGRVDLFLVTGTGDVFLASQVTTNKFGQRGYYNFTNLASGTYRVTVDPATLPPTLSFFTTLQSYEVMISATQYVITNADFGVIIGDPTAVDLTYLRARHVPAGVQVEWGTAAEVDTAGFHLLRATSEDGERVRVTPSLIPGSEDGSGQAYAWLDATAAAGERYLYWLEETEHSGKVNLYGPVAAVTDAAAAGGKAAFTVAEAGVYLIRAAALKAAGLDVAGVVADRLEVSRGGAPVAAFCSAEGRPLGEDDYLLFYAAEAGPVTVSLVEAGARMPYAYAGPVGGEAIYVAAEASGTTRVETPAGLGRALVHGLADDAVLLLDVTDPGNVQLLFGAESLATPLGAGLYFGFDRTVPGIYLVIEISGVRELGATTGP
jgi:hypothetical protein